MSMFKLYWLAGFWSYPDARAEDFWCGFGMSWRCRLLVFPWLLKAVPPQYHDAQLTHKFRWIFQMNTWIKSWWVAPWHCTSRRLRMWRVAWRRWHWSKLPCLGHGDFPMFDVPPEGNNPTRWLYIYIYPHDIPIIFLISLLYPYYILIISLLYPYYPYYSLGYYTYYIPIIYSCLPSLWGVVTSYVVYFADLHGNRLGKEWHLPIEGRNMLKRGPHTHTNMIYNIIYTH